MTMRCLITVALAGAVAAAHGQSAKWWFSKDGQQAVLSFGTGDAETTIMAFTCRLGSGRVRLFIAETSEALKPNRPATAVLAAGQITTNISGKTIPNEDAGVPSFQGELSAADPLFAAMPGAKTLSAAVGTPRQTAPLRTIATQSTQFAAACRKA